MKELLKPTESELEILQVLWQHGPSTVRFVNEQLNGKKEVGYTTTLKIMQIIYKAVLQEKETQKQLLDKFLDATFRGSAMTLVMQVLGNRSTSKEDLEQIKNLIQKLEGDKK
jgi:BlaI family transcriptional regulator, penicillinase repressor